MLGERKPGFFCVFVVFDCNNEMFCCILVQHDEVHTISMGHIMKLEDLKGPIPSILVVLFTS